LLEGPAPGTIIRGAFGYEDWMDSVAANFAGEAVSVVKLYEPRSVPNFLAEQGPLISLFVACYNEAENIVDTLKTVIQACSIEKISFEIIIIDDASSDNSAAIIRDFMQKNPEIPISLHINLKNQGLGANFGEAAFKAKGTYYRLICGDNVEPVQTLVAVFREIGKADIILTYRPSDVEGKSLLRRWLSRLYTIIVNFISGYNIKYYNGLPIMLRHDVVRWQPNSHGFGFQADLVTRLLDRERTYIEVPVASIERLEGKAKAIRLRNLCSVAHSLLNILIRRFSKIVYGNS